MTGADLQPSSPARIIREACAEGRLIAKTELLRLLRARPVAPGASAPSSDELEEELRRASAEDADLRLVYGPEGEEFYRCAGLMSATYAEILAGKSAPCLLMAETVRKNSRDYPRPIPLDIFEYPPFDLAPETIRGCLRRMAAEADFGDIGFVESSEGTVYLYSDRYLERDYAAFLAERLDVDLALNP